MAGPSAAGRAGPDTAAELRRYNSNNDRSRRPLQLLEPVGRSRGLSPQPPVGPPPQGFNRPPPPARTARSLSPAPVAALRPLPAALPPAPLKAPSGSLAGLGPSDVAAGLQQLRDALGRRKRDLESQLQRASAERDTEAACTQRLSFALARQADQGEASRLELAILERRCESAGRRLREPNSASAGQPDHRVDALRAETAALRRELQVLRREAADSAAEGARLKSDLSFQQPLLAKLAADLREAEAEGERLQEEARDLRALGEFADEQKPSAAWLEASLLELNLG